MAFTDAICEIHRYVHPRPGRNSWWFRRRVPRALIEVIGETEWRQGLKARTRDAAMHEAMPHYLRTNEIIALAEKGDWPPLTLDEATALAKQWAIAPPLMTRERSLLDEPTFDNDAAFIASADAYLAENASLVRPGTTAYQAFVAHARSRSSIGNGKGEFRRAGLPLQFSDLAGLLKKIESAPAGKPATKPILFNDPYPHGSPDDLIGEYARRRKKGSRSEKAVRGMMRRLTEISGVNNLAMLTRQQVEEWADHLDKTRASNTVKSNLEWLRILANFAIERDYLKTENPAAKVKYVGKPIIKIRGYTDAEARVVLSWARTQTTPYLRWLPWVCCFTGCRIEEVAGAHVRDFGEVGSYWVFSVRLDNRPDDASLKTESSVRKIPLHPALVAEGFINYLTSLPRGAGLFPELRADAFGSKGGTATKRLGPRIRRLGDQLESLAERSLQPSHSWRHRLHNEFRRTRERQDVEDRLIGHASEGSGPGYGEYEIIDVLGPAIEQTRSPFGLPVSPARTRHGTAGEAV